MNDERQRFEKPVKPSPAGPVANRAVLRRGRRHSRAGHAWMRMGAVGESDLAGQAKTGTGESPVLPKDEL